MSTTPWQIGTDDFIRVPRTGWLGLLGGCSVWLILGVCLLPLAADEFNIRDLQHELLVRSELTKDPQIGPCNLIVGVKNRVATLSGFVPSRELAVRALNAAKAVPEIVQVRDNMTIRVETNAAASAPIGPPPSKASAPIITTATPSAQPMPEQPKKALPGQGAWMPVHSTLASESTHGVALLPAIATQPSFVGSVSLPKESDLAEAVRPPDAAAIASAVKSLIQDQARFRRLRFEVKQNKVFLSGAVNHWSDLHELARAAVRIPGVDGVVVRDVKTEAGGN